MCGIVGYVGPVASERALEVVMEGLGRMEYRGYDSAGVALVADGKVVIRKRAGKLTNLTSALAEQGMPIAATGIGHTRWATHGGPTDANAHPQRGGSDGKLAVVHNGIIENFHGLRTTLLDDGVAFTSETDTEVVAHLLARAYDSSGDLTEAMRSVVSELNGAFTLLAVHADSPDTIVAARRNSPLVVGLGEGENFLGSDVAAFIGHTRQALELGQDQIVTITADSYAVIDFDGTPSDGKAYEVTWDAAAAEKGGFATFMEKEIYDQPKAVQDTLFGRTDETGALVLDEVSISEEELAQVNKIVMVACGTAAYAGMVAKYAIERWTRIPVEVELAHEFRYRDPVIDEKTLVVSISQSGETMDTLMAVRHAIKLGAKTVSICNTHGSTIPRESDAVLYTHAGPEIAVASTKAFLAQITASYVLGLYLTQLRGESYGRAAADVMRDLHEIPDKIQSLLENMDRVREIAHFMADSRAVLFLGRHVGYPVAMEGALKLKELAYIHAEGFAAGELKHGPIALIEPGQPVFIIVP
ncbi:MAG: glutamine--fructose-6-phosphate transaminase (isomerizing), partial [Ornithinimicrobium sp.]